MIMFVNILSCYIIQYYLCGNEAWGLGDVILGLMESIIVISQDDESANKEAKTKNDGLQQTITLANIGWCDCSHEPLSCQHVPKRMSNEQGLLVQGWTG